MSFFIDEDMAYLFGLIIGRGTLKGNGGLKQIIINFPYKNLKATGIQKTFKQRDVILLSLDPIINRLGELIGQVPAKIESRTSVDIVIGLNRNNLIWRNVLAFTNNRHSFRDVEIASEIFSASAVIKKEFIRGVADVTSYARPSNALYRYRGEHRRHRIYFEIHNANWRMPIQLCTLLQSEPLCIPVQTIDWGHPNIRNGNATEYNAGRKTAWAREHQLKIFAEHFEPIGFRITHKNEILKEMAEYNRSAFPDQRDKLCTPPKRIMKRKVKHPAEGSVRLPAELRGKHFDTYWQVCKELGCVRYDRKDICSEKL